MLAALAPALGHADPYADSFYFNFYGPLQPPTSLPGGLRATMLVPIAEEQKDRAANGPIDTLRDLFPALAACWRAPEGLAGLERTEITARFSLRRDGSLIGTPRITFSTLPADTRARQVLTDATFDALRRCTPIALTPALGGAIAGRPISLRFVYEGPRGKTA